MDEMKLRTLAQVEEFLEATLTTKNVPLGFINCRAKVGFRAYLRQATTDTRLQVIRGHCFEFPQKEHAGSQGFFLALLFSPVLFI